MGSKALFFSFLPLKKQYAAAKINCNKTYLHLFTAKNRIYSLAAGPGDASEHLYGVRAMDIAPLSIYNEEKRGFC